MATAVLAANKTIVWKKINEAIANDRNEVPARRRLSVNVWQSAGVPAGATGNALGDLCYDYANDDVYVCTTAGTTWTKITA